MTTVVLTTDQIPVNEPEYRVISGGEYEADALVSVYHQDDITKTAIVAFQAHYIATGEHV